MKQHTKRQRKCHNHKKAYNDAVAAVSEINQGELVVKVQEAIDELEIATLLADEFNTIVDNAAKNNRNVTG